MEEHHPDDVDELTAADYEEPDMTGIEQEGNESNDIPNITNEQLEELSNLYDNIGSSDLEATVEKLSTLTDDMRQYVDSKFVETEQVDGFFNAIEHLIRDFEEMKSNFDAVSLKRKVMEILNGLFSVQSAEFIPLEPKAEPEPKLKPEPKPKQDTRGETTRTQTRTQTQTRTRTHTW